VAKLVLGRFFREIIGGEKVMKWILSGVIIFLIAVSPVLVSCNRPSESVGGNFWKERKGDISKNNPQGGVPQSFAGLAKELNPAVVNVNTTQVIKGRRFGRPSPFPGPYGGRDPFEDFWEKFFGREDRPHREFKQRSLGSGFIISKDGYIITNNHVVEKATEIKVTIGDGDDYDAKVVGKDPKTDLALLKINPKGDLPLVALGNSDRLEVGEWVLAIGNPFGLEHTVTAGIVSAKGRVIGAGPYDDFIQTDASINPGNSGGPLFNLAGEVVGINTAIIASGQGIGFAIPINIAKELLPQLREKGRVTRGWLGVAVQKVTEDLAKSFNLKKKNGALVADVVAGGPAEKAGIERGDVIIEFDGQEVKEMNELPRIVANTPIGKEVNVKVLRDGREKTFKVSVGELKEEREVTLRPTVKEFEEELGLTVQPLTSEMAPHFGPKETEGVVVSDVYPGSPADEAGIRRGDIIQEINRRPIKDMDSYQEALEEGKDKDSLLLFVRRGENTIYLTLNIPG
jgi:serine protease Do